MHVILGAGGVIANEVGKELHRRGIKARLFARNPICDFPEQEAIKGDLLNPESIRRAVDGTEVAYLTAGLKYDKKVWKRDWPRLMSNVAEACIQSETKLVFFDNIYALDPNTLENITEEAAINPISEKGEVRAEVLRILWEAVDQKGLKALVARSADFYGPGNTNSAIVETIFKPLSLGKKANWMGKLDLPHSATFTPDAGKACVMLALDSTAFGQTWNLPTAKNPPNGKQWAEMVASELNSKAKVRAAGTMLVRLMGIFVPIMKEFVEMMYQFNNSYIFNSDKIEKQYNIQPTSYEQGIKEVLKADLENWRNS